MYLSWTSLQIRLYEYNMTRRFSRGKSQEIIDAGKLMHLSKADYGLTNLDWPFLSRTASESISSLLQPTSYKDKLTHKLWPQKNTKKQIFRAHFFILFFFLNSQAGRAVVALANLVMSPNSFFLRRSPSFSALLVLTVPLSS